MNPSIRHLFALILAVYLPALAGCSGAASRPGEPIFVATVPPLGMILTELARDRADVKVLLAGGASPHTYEPRPSDARLAASAHALFYVSEGLDAWAAKLQAKQRVEVLEFVPEALLLPGEIAAEEHAMHDHADHGHADHGHHDHGEFDPHVWSDPALVKAMLPKLAEALEKADPEGGATYRKNATSFAARLDALDAELAATLAPLNGRPVILFHLSLQYLLHHYGLKLAAVMEPSPGKEASPKYIRDVIETAQHFGVKVIFSEPQLPRRPAEAIAQAAGVTLAELDPYGGLPGRETYDALLRYNADTLRKALE